MDKIFYAVYKITNKIDGKFYIGTHKTKNLDDSYMGSGKYLKRAQEKYGIESFEKEILFVFDNPKDMYDKEAELVNEDFLALENTYNLKVGGFGGWDYTTKMPNHGVAGRIASNKLIAHRGGTAKQLIHGRGEKFKQSALTSFSGRQHSQKAKDSIAEKNSLNQLGEGNSQFGTMWITNGEKPIKIKKTDTIPDGYRKGRK